MMLPVVHAGHRGAENVHEPKKGRRAAAVIRTVHEKHVESLGKVANCVSSTWGQILAYLVCIVMFQVLQGEMRNRAETFMYKHITDLLLEAPFTQGGNMDDIYMGIGEVVDIHTWGDAVLWPALLQDTYPREPTDDDDVPHFRTPKELAEQIFDELPPCEV